MKNLEQIFFPDKKEVPSHFVHYTNAEAAMNILQGKEIWLRKPSLMNDFSEVILGIRYVKDFLNSIAGESFKKALNSIFDQSITDDIEKRFEENIPTLKYDTYLTCVSEHKKAEDTLGRLSMWRAYGGSSGIAIVMNSKAFFQPSNTLKAYITPVAYSGWEGFENKFKMITKNIDDDRIFLKSIDKEFQINTVL